MVTVTANKLEKDEIIKALDEVGFEADVFSFSNHDEVLIEEREQEISNEAYLLRQKKAKLSKKNIKKEQRGHLLASLLLLPLGLTLFVLTFVSTPLTWPWLLSISLSSISACLLSSFEMYKTAWRRLRKKQTSMDLLFSISTLSALLVSLLALVNPMVSMEFHTALLILGAHRLGQYLKSKMQENFEISERFSERLPQKVSRLKPFPLKVGVLKPEVVARDEVLLGDEIIVYPGEVIPLDGIVLNTQAEIITTMQDGDLNAKPASPGMGVLAGMRVQSGSLRLKVCKRAHECYAVKVEEALEVLDEHKSSLESVADKIMNYFIPSILLMTAVCALMTFAIAGPLMALHTALAMLVSACPCTLGLIVPFAVRAGASRIAREGVITNNVQAMEKAANIKTVAFDLNGTLTKGQLSVKELQVSEGAQYQTIMNLLYTLENHAQKESNHPIANTVAAFAKEKGGVLIEEANGFDLTSNTGLHASILGKRYYLGNNDFAKEHGLKGVRAKSNQLYLFDEQKTLLARLKMQDPLKPEAKPAIRALKKEGYRVIVITGADKLSALSLTAQLGLDEKDVYASVLGATAKGALLSQLERSHGPIAMVGDGANDLLALKQARLGVSFDNGDRATKSNADFIIKNESLYSVGNLLKLSKGALSIIKLCLGASLAYNVLAIVLTCCLAVSIGAMSPVVMASMMAVQALMVLGFATRIKSLPGVTKRTASQESLTQAMASIKQIRPRFLCCTKKRPEPTAQEGCVVAPTLRMRGS